MLRDYVPSFVEQAESPAKNLCLGTLHEHILNLVRKATLPTEYLSLDNIEDDDASDVEGAILLPPDQVKRRTFPRITIFVCMFLLTTAWPVYYATSTLLSHLYWKSEASSITSALLEELYGGLKIPIGQETFTTPSQETYSVPQVHWNQPLGKQVLILDVDTRPLNGSGQYLQDPSSSWDLMDSRATGLLNHYLYCMSSHHKPRCQVFTNLPSANPRLRIHVPTSRRSTKPRSILGQNHYSQRKAERLPHHRLHGRRCFVELS